MDKVAVVILNYNGQKFLEKFLSSVVTHTPEGVIYVVDNASTDDSNAYVQTHHPTVKWIQLPKNYGFAEGYNQGLQQIQAEYYVLLNSDVEVPAMWCSPLFTFMEAHPEVAACQPKIRAFDQKTHFEYAGAAGGFVDWLGFSYCRGRIFFDTEEDAGQYDDSMPVFWASGACMMVRARVFHEVGGFDGDFFAHFEEIDLCWRLQLAGHEVWCVSQSVVYHVGGGTLPPNHPYKTYLNHRNSLAMLYKNLPPSRLWSTIFARLVVDGVSAARFLPKAQWQNIWAVIKAHFGFYQWLFTNLPAKRHLIKTSYDLEQRWLIMPILTQSVIWQYFVKNKKTYHSLSTH